MRRLSVHLSLFLVLLMVACGGQPKPKPQLYSIGGSVTDLSGVLTLQNNGANDLVIAADGPFTFSTKVADGNAYDVTVKQAPTTQNCAVSNGAGTIHGADVTNVLVTCADKTWHRPADLIDHLGIGGRRVQTPGCSERDRRCGDGVGAERRRWQLADLQG